MPVYWARGKAATVSKTEIHTLKSQDLLENRAEFLLLLRATAGAGTGAREQVAGRWTVWCRVRNTDCELVSESEPDPL